MRITRSNFFQNLPQILKELSESHCVALDFELSGICHNELLQNFGSDSYQLRYWKIKENIKHLLPLQVGLCGYKIIDKNTIETFPYGFYLFPNPFSPILDMNFKMEVFCCLNFSTKKKLKKNYEYFFTKKGIKHSVFDETWIRF